MANSGDTQAHERTYSSFTTLLKWGSVVVAIATFAVILIIAN